MIILFGCSWARNAWEHTNVESTYGYKHWRLPDTWVINSPRWLNSFFTKDTVVNFARYANTTDWMIRDLYHATNTVSNFTDRMDFVVFQTDPLRIFAPRQDYNDYNIVWPNFQAWAEKKQFDWQNRSFDDLLETIYRDYYQNLVSFESSSRYMNPGKEINLWLVGGVSRVHPCVTDFNLNVIIDSVTGLFGFDEDCCLENRASLISLTKFWGDKLTDPAKKHAMRQTWKHYDDLLAKKEDFWVNNQDLFAGRHTTEKAMTQVAQYIESKIY